MSALPYRTPAVRDLAWACFSPPLMLCEQMVDDGALVADCGLALTPARRQWLEGLDRQPGALLAFLAAGQSRRLGLYYERLWHFFLGRDPALELVAHNLVVREAGRTLGEFDVIYWCHERQRHFHLELAVKFFLGCRQQTTFAAASHWHEWLGPDREDRLDLKLEQILARQILLGDRPAAREQLAALGIAGLAREIAIRGYLFRPHRDPLPPPFGFNPRLQLQQWLPLEALAGYLQDLPAERFQLLPKARWLTPVRLDEPAGAAADGRAEGLAQEPQEFIGRSMLAGRLQSLHTAGGRARLVAGIGRDGRESSRFFVTPNNWPGGRHHLQRETS